MRLITSVRIANRRVEEFMVTYQYHSKEMASTQLTMEDLHNLAKMVVNDIDKINAILDLIEENSMPRSYMKECASESRRYIQLTTQKLHTIINITKSNM